MSDETFFQTLRRNIFFIEKMDEFMLPLETVRPVSFDLTKPHGPTVRTDDWMMMVSPKTIQFQCKASTGYDCVVSLSSMEGGTDSLHVFALHLEFLEYEYGWNAVRIAFDQGDTRECSIDSQHFACDEQCMVTCFVCATHVDLYVESGPNPDRLPRLDEKCKPIVQDEKGVVYHHMLTLDPQQPTPQVKLSMMRDNKVSIVNPRSTRASDYHSTAFGAHKAYMYA